MKRTILNIKPEILKLSYEILNNQVGTRELTGKNDGDVVKYLKSVGLSSGNPYCMAGQYYCFDMACRLMSINTFTKREAKQRRLSKASIETYVHLIRIRMVYEGVERGWLPESAIAESYNKKAKRPNSSSFSKVLERAAKVRQSNKEKASRPTSISSLLKITSGPEAARLLGIPFSEFSEYVSGKRMPSDDLRGKAKELVTKGLSRRLPEALLYPHGNEKVSRWTINSM